MPRTTSVSGALIFACALIAATCAAIAPLRAADLIIAPSALSSALAAPLIKLIANPARAPQGRGRTQAADIDPSLVPVADRPDRPDRHALANSCPPGYACVTCLANCPSDTPGIIHRRRLPSAASEPFPTVNAESGVRSAGNWSSLQCYPEGGCTSSGVVAPPRRNFDVHITVHRTYWYR
jgi:hypothetical protein